MYYGRNNSRPMFLGRYSKAEKGWLSGSILHVLTCLTDILAPFASARKRIELSFPAPIINSVLPYNEPWIQISDSQNMPWHALPSKTDPTATRPPRLDLAGKPAHLRIVLMVCHVSFQKLALICRSHWLVRLAYCRTPGRSTLRSTVPQTSDEMRLDLPAA